MGRKIVGCRDPRHVHEFGNVNRRGKRVYGGPRLRRAPAPIICRNLCRRPVPAPRVFLRLPFGGGRCVALQRHNGISHDVRAGRAPRNHRRRSAAAGHCQILARPASTSGIGQAHSACPSSPRSARNTARARRRLSRSPPLLAERSTRPPKYRPTPIPAAAPSASCRRNVRTVGSSAGPR